MPVSQTVSIRATIEVMNKFESMNAFVKVVSLGSFA